MQSRGKDTGQDRPTLMQKTGCLQDCNSNDTVMVPAIIWRRTLNFKFKGLFSKCQTKNTKIALFRCQNVEMSGE
jgi:hypothetical protein